MYHAAGVHRDQPAYYRICIQGTLAPTWSTMLGNMTITTEQSDNHQYVTTLQGWLVDQAALLGVLNLICELNVPLVLVERELRPHVLGAGEDNDA